MRIIFNWSAVTGLVDWLIEPEVIPQRGLKITSTPKVNKGIISKSLRRIIPRKKESRGQRMTIALLKHNESLKRKGKR